ncbi:CHAT domain-containing protein [Scytonema sp. UIC 10036]|uniref:CHAT domain-containing protein n=1 Tax=Scytonema sp. UIC 10036 TaxID=2304196 RepID=UPI0012DA6304|nr:CHAT domain-containing protein [Scytonema sp. UIC 10036]MUG91941.1 CHAT domain-containing protein [Scytonema sp. UIC 10036]
MARLAPESDKQFVLEVLQTTLNSAGDADIVYPLLAANTDKLNHIFAKQLHYWATKTLAEIEPSTAKDIAEVIFIFSNLIQQFPLGSKANNIEIAITGYEIVLTVYTRSAFPKKWADTQNNLGSVYLDRIIGERKENIELALAACFAALEVRTRNSFPKQWAMTQINLGNAYLYRIIGERKENIELALSAYSAALAVYTRSDFPQQWATTQINLGNAYLYRIIGERKENIELALAAFSDALTVYTRSDFPQQWATTQIGLGAAYYDRILGERKENLELAIKAYSGALEVYTRSDFPEDWATTQNHLGNAYLHRILGERKENIELALAAFFAALSVYTRNDFPEQWAMTQNNLASAYDERISGERKENIEKAIAAYSAAQEVLTRYAFPEKWAAIQNNLGNAYCDRILGEQAENIEKAIAAYSAALSVYTRSAFPEDWAATQNNLGTAYRNRILGEQAENIEKAIAAYSAAQEVLTRNAFPEQWAITQISLGNAYCSRILEEQADIEKAMAAYSAAQEVLTRNAFPEQWAMTQTGLGSAYGQRISGEKAQNIEQAIEAYSAALEVYTRNAFPLDWAMTQYNLGTHYYRRILGERAENIELAIKAYSAALSVYTRGAFPERWVTTQTGLGVAYSERILGERTENIELAYNTFADAIVTVESLRGEITSGNESKRKQAEKWHQLYLFIVRTCLELGKITEAIEYVERSKTRNLVELILERDLKTIFPLEVATQLEQLREEIASGQYQLQNGKAENPTDLAKHLQQLRQKRQELQDSDLPIGSGFKFDQFHKTLAQKTAIIEWYITNDRIITFVVKPKGQELKFFQSTKEEFKELSDCENKYLEAYYNQQDKRKLIWQNQLEDRLKELAKILHIEEILEKELPTEKYDRLILIPHRSLHLFPLHALPIKESYLIDLFPNGVGYAPSCQLLQQAQLRQRPNFKSLFAIQNPTEDLNYANLEVDNILPLFSSQEVLKNSQATKDAFFQATPQLREVNCLHFSCHGSFNFKSPLDSYLQLANSYTSPVFLNPDPIRRYLLIKLLDDFKVLDEVLEQKVVDLTECLTLGNLFEQDFVLNQCRLVVLSACETGLVEFVNLSDEYIGLPSGFLYAGSVNVVSSLWIVDDLSTALLIIKLYQNLKDGLTVVCALNKAQIWLRNASVKDLLDWSKTSKINKNMEQEIQDTLECCNPEERRFSSLFHWAAFCAIGQ